MSKPSRKQLDLCNNLEIDVPAGATMASVRHLIAHELNIRKRNTKDGIAAALLKYCQNNKIKSGSILHASNGIVRRVIGISTEGLVTMSLDGKIVSATFFTDHQVQVIPSSEHDIPNNYFPISSIYQYLKCFHEIRYHKKTRSEFGRIIENEWRSCKTLHSIMYYIESTGKVVKAWSRAKQSVHEAENTRLVKKVNRPKKRKRFCYFCGKQITICNNKLSCDACNDLIHDNDVRFCFLCSEQIKRSCKKRCPACISKANT